MKNTGYPFQIRLILVPVILILLAGGANAIPQQINYQGIIKYQSNGQSVSDGNYQITYRMYNASSGGSALWTEVAADTVIGGILNHNLGSVSTLNLSFNQDYYLSIQLTGDAEMSPREHLTSVGYAFMANNAVSALSAATANTLNGGAVNQLTGGNGITVSGSTGTITLSLSSSWSGNISGSSNISTPTLSISNTGGGIGVYGLSNDSSGNYSQAGVWGQNNQTFGIGVYGQATGNFASGVYGLARLGVGVFGMSTGGGYGIEGYVNNNGIAGVLGSSDSTHGVYGQTSDTSNQHAGVWGENDSGGIAVRGKSQSGGTGIYGSSDTGNGIFGITNDGNFPHAGVSGKNDHNLGIGVYGQAIGTLGYGVYGLSGPGTGVYGRSTSGIVGVEGIANFKGTGVLGSSDSGNGVYGTTNDTSGQYASVWGENDVGGIAVRGKSLSWGTGIYGSSDTGNGVYGISKDSTYSHAGVWGQNDSKHGIAVYGQAYGSSGYGVLGISSSGIAVYGASNSSFGLYGTSQDGTGIYGSSNTSYGIYGISHDTTGTRAGVTGVNLSKSGNGVYGSGLWTGVWGESAAGSGVWGRSTLGGGSGVFADDENPSSFDSYGIYAYSKAGYALYAEGFVSCVTDVNISGNLDVHGSKSGYVVDLCKSIDNTSLELGDVVTIQGNSPAIFGKIPVMNVSKTTTEYDSAVVGVVDSFVQITTNNRTTPMAKNNELSTNTPQNLIVKAHSSKSVDNGEYVHIVTLGAFQAIKVDAGFGAIHPGDLLTASSHAGYAMKAQPIMISGRPFYSSGCIIGKALASLESGQGTIPVFVGHQ